jgi:hypothetical protein
VRLGEIKFWGIIVLAFALYLPLAQFPFVQDDWGFLHLFVFGRTPDIVSALFSPVGQFFYRPAGAVYCWLVYLVFGLTPIGFHVLSVIALCGTGLLVVLIALDLTGDARVAWPAGFLYVAAASVHLDTQMWLVGAFDIGAAFFSLLCLATFSRKRYVVSAIFFALSLGFKESALMILPVLICYAILSSSWRSLVRLWLHALIVGGWTVCKSLGSGMLALPPEHIYYAQILGPHTAENIGLYAGWLLNALLPVKNIMPAAFIAATKVKLKQSSVFLLAWFVLAMIPLTVLQNQTVRYYLLPAVAPAAIGAMVALRSLLGSKGAKNLVLISGLLVAGTILDSAVFVQRKIALGVMEGVPATHDGYNHLIRKASVVRETREQLLSAYPSLPAHSAVALGNAVAFGGSLGLQVWYGDSTLQVVSGVPGRRK